MRPDGEGLHLPRALLLALLAWWTLSMATGISSWCFLDLVNLAFHEAGHVFLSFAGSTVHYLGGTLFQLLIPGLLVFYFLKRQRQPLGAAFCAWWAGENLINIAVYMADARSLALPLVGGGDHDWNELFYRFGVLTEPGVARVSGATHLAGVLMMLAGLAWTAYFVLPSPQREQVRARLTARWPWLETALEA
ncbi:MAG: hypothetical protein PVF68_16460 [Acidobacteriota bacterium]|jgi:hypothetical protein